MATRDSIFTGSLGVLVPFEAVKVREMSEFRRVKGGYSINAYVMLAPAGMERVETPAPVRPLTLQVKSVEVTSVTGLLLGGIRIPLL